MAKTKSNSSSLYERIENLKDAVQQKVQDRLNEETLKSMMKKLGLATQADVKALEKKVEALATELRDQIESLMKNKKS